MHTVLFAAPGERADTFTAILASEGYGTQHRVATVRLTDDDLTAIEGSPIVFCDLQLGADAVGQIVRQMRAYPPVARNPLVALIGEPQKESFDQLIADGADLYITDNPQTLAFRTRFLRGALERRQQLAKAMLDARISEENYKSVIAVLDEGIVVRSRDGVIRTINASAARLLQLGRNADGTIAGGDEVDLGLLREDGTPLARDEQPGLRAIATGKAIHETIAGVARGGDETRWMSMNASPLRDPVTGEITGSVTSMTDITARRRAESQLMASDRLAALGRLAASVGHEINNPLTYLIGNLELALRRVHSTTGESDPLLPLLGDALEGAERVRRIVDDLRLFARRRADDETAIDVAAVIASCVRMAHGEIRHHAQLAVELATLPLVRGNEARLAQVITNLMLNAAQSISEDEPERNRISVTGQVGDDGRVEIRVADSGAGISAEHLPLVFEPFFTTKSGRGGTGLGLAITRTLVNEMGGEILLASEVGRGTEVTLLLRPAVSAPAAIETATPIAVPRRRRVLLVEDEPKIAELLRENLTPHDVTIASGGEAALALLATDSAFDAIVCDLMMPGTGGIEVHEHLRANQPGLEQRIVFMTGGAFTPRATSFLARVANRCLAKPFAIGRLLSAIDEVTGG